jgi:hypothetical protein
MRRRQYSVDDNYFDKITNEKAWLIGLLAADGCIHKNKYIILGQSGNNGLILIKYVKKLLKFSGPIERPKIIKPTHKQQYKIQITSPRLVSKLKEYNIISRKSLIYEFPEKIKPYLYSFLRGYIDGDGCVYIEKRKYISRLTISVIGTMKFIDRCSELLPGYTGKYHKRRCVNLWEIQWFGKKAKYFGNILWKNKNLYNSTKRKKFMKFLTKD